MTSSRRQRRAASQRWPAGRRRCAGRVRGVLLRLRGGASARSVLSPNRRPALLRPANVLTLALGVLAAALCVTMLRTEMLRIRYALPAVNEEEQRLIDEQRSLTVRMRQLRDPVRLAKRARELGFVRPERLVDLPATREDSSTALADAGAVVAPAPLDPR